MMPADSSLGHVGSSEEPPGSNGQCRQRSLPARFAESTCNRAGNFQSNDRIATAVETGAAPLPPPQARKVAESFRVRIAWKGSL